MDLLSRSVARSRKRAAVALQRKREITARLEPVPAPQHPVATVAERRREQWEELADWPLTIAALLFLGAYAWPILDTTLSRGWVHACQAVTWVTWAMLGVDYMVRLLLSRRRGLFMRRNLLDLTVVALPLLRPLRLLRLVTLLSVLNRYVGATLRGRVAAYVLMSTSLVIFVSALAVLDAERGREGANINSFGDALWWAASTVTTVGYGDRFPVTVTGRVVAVFLMLAGIALLGVVTASVASYLLERVQRVEEESQSATWRDIEHLAEEVTALRAVVAEAVRAARAAEQAAGRAPKA